MQCYCVLKQNWMERNVWMKRNWMKRLCECTHVRIYRVHTCVSYMCDIYVIHNLLYSDVNLKREICKSLKDQVLV